MNAIDVYALYYFSSYFTFINMEMKEKTGVGTEVFTSIFNDEEKL